jgi:hypothetical protein
MRAIYELQGVRGIQDLVDRATKETKGKLERACRDTAIAVVTRAKANAPKDRGDLAASIASEGKGTNWRVGLLDRSIPSRGGSNSAHLNPSVYGVWYELGFVTRKIAQHKFMEPAIEAEAVAHQNRISAALIAGLRTA